jgi:hypothetical protein
MLEAIMKWWKVRTLSAAVLSRPDVGSSKKIANWKEMLNFATP